MYHAFGCLPKADVLHGPFCGALCWKVSALPNRFCYFSLVRQQTKSLYGAGFCLLQLFPRYISTGAVCSLIPLKNAAAGQHPPLLPSLLLPQSLDILWDLYSACSLPRTPFLLLLLTMKEHIGFVFMALHLHHSSTEQWYFYLLPSNINCNHSHSFIWDRNIVSWTIPSF